MADANKKCSSKSIEANDPNYVCNPLTGRLIQIGSVNYLKLVAKNLIKSDSIPKTQIIETNIPKPKIQKVETNTSKTQIVKIPLKLKSKIPQSPKTQVIEKNQTIVTLPISKPKDVWFLDRPIEDYSWKEDGIYLSPSGEKFILPNNKQFSAFINKRFGKYKITTDIGLTSCQPQTTTSSKPALFPHQAFVIDYMSPDRPYRGLLLDHNLGSGKTRESVETAEKYRLLGVRVMILLPATLKPTWINEIRLWGNEDVRRPSNFEQLPPEKQLEIDAKINQNIANGYDFVSYNAANTLQLLKKVTGGELRHRFIIVEECHNLISMIVNPNGKKGLNMYKMLMAATDCKFLFLSATPLLNLSYELGVLFNILKGPMMHKGQRYTLFPEIQDDFDDYFVDYEKQTIRNPELFKKRIVGLVSYYYGAKGDVYPDLILTPPTEIVFGDYQFKKYSVARLVEIERESVKSNDKLKSVNLTGIKKKSTSAKPSTTANEVKSTFRIFSRQFSNFVFPEGVKRPLPNDFSSLAKINLHANPDKWTESQIEELYSIFEGDDELYEQFKKDYQEQTTDVDRLDLLHQTIEDYGHEANEFTNITSDEEQFIFDNLEMPSSYKIAIDNAIALLDKNKQEYFRDKINRYGPKMEMIYRNLIEGNGHQGPALIYSQFLTLEGVNMLAKVLEAHDFTRLMPMEINASNISSYAKDGKQRYAVYSGAEDNVVRDKILKLFNHPLNQHGEICKCLLITSSGAEGISLKGTRQVHILEPYWNEVRIQQVIGRGRRICSHHALPKSERKVYVYRYHMILSEKQKKTFPEQESTDQAIYRIAKLKEKINAQFLQILKDSAVDCVLNAYYNVTIENPITCFAFDESDTGISFYPSIGQDGFDKPYLSKQETLNYATFNVYGTDNQQFYKDGDYLYVYKFAGDPKIIKQEKIKIPSKGVIITATVLYDKVVAQKGNMFLPKLALVDKHVLPSNVFIVV